MSDNIDLRTFGPAGRRLIREVVEQLSDDGLDPDARDRALLRTAGELADRMDRLRALVKKDGECSVSKTGIVRLHPAIAEHRQHAVALAKVLGSVSLAETNGAPKDPNKVRAAQARWREHNLAKAAGEKPRRSAKGAVDG